MLREMAARRLSPVELMQATLDRAEEVKRDYAAFITIDADTALARARHVEQEMGSAKPQPPLAGIPIAFKDTEDTAGLRTTYGSPLFGDHVPTQDCAVVDNARKSGAIVFAKTNTPAFAHNDSSDNLLGPSVRNPRVPTHSSAGSSSGAAAAVAAGVSPFAHGTDGSGSVRIPASVCGIVGFKPSYGRVPAWPHRDLWAARTHHGVLARTVEDAAVGMLALAGASDFDPLVNSSPVDWLGYGQQDVRRQTGVYVEQLGVDAVDPDVARCCRRAVQLLQREGLAIDERHLDLEPTHDWYCDLWHPPVARQLGSFLESRPDAVDETLKDIIRRGQAVSIERFLAAREARSRFHTQFTRRMAGVSFIVSPTLPCAAWPLGQLPTIGGGTAPAFGISGSRWESVYLFNILGWPAISIPCGTTPDGRPVGLQIVTRKDQDLCCLKIADLLEQLLLSSPHPQP
ncbi:Glutamyl-tRNA(Gln) amidotransferase subunit A (plasmid) [Variovorax sp. SRS16]|nr:Glutamyl-tRNA(Gln) amidotransferase subunit A [Variovorax sp. SRS16]